MRRTASLLAGVALALAAAVGLGGAPAVAGSSALRPNSVPAKYVTWVKKVAAQSSCKSVTAPILAALIEQESTWNPNAVSSIGAQGLTQFLPGTWREWGRDAEGDGRSSPFDPEDAIDAGGRYLCFVYKFMYDRKGTLPGDLNRLALWGYNAGPWATEAARGKPPTAEARQYADRILGQLIQKYRP